MSQQNRRILVADGERDVRMLLYETLSLQGFDVVVAENGLMAMEMAQQSDFDLVITEIEMAELDGLELLREIKKQECSPPVLMMTGRPSVNTAISALKYGAYDYLLKPLSMEGMQHVMERALSDSETTIKAEKVVKRHSKLPQKTRKIMTNKPYKSLPFQDTQKI